MAAIDPTQRIDGNLERCKRGKLVAMTVCVMVLGIYLIGYHVIQSGGFLGGGLGG